MIAQELIHSFDLTRDQARMLGRYASLIDLHARPLGLVGFPANLDSEHIARSLFFIRLLQPGESVVDVGSGAGLPGIPIAIVHGGAILLEPRRKGVGFLEKVVRELGLDAQVIGKRAEAYHLEAPESADVVVARSLAAVEPAVRLCAPLCRPGGRVILASGPRQEGVEEPMIRGLIRYGLAAPKLLDFHGPLDIRQRMLMMTKLPSTSP